jgi:hypothetical protein
VGKSQADKAMEYVDFARHCLKIAKSLSDREDRITHREMAAEWIKLAGDAADQGAASSANDQKTKRTAGRQLKR